MTDDEDGIGEVTDAIFNAGIDISDIAVDEGIGVDGANDFKAFNFDGIDTVNGVDVVEKFSLKSLRGLPFRIIEGHVISPSVVLLEFNEEACGSVACDDGVVIEIEYSGGVDAVIIVVVEIGSRFFLFEIERFLNERSIENEFSGGGVLNFGIESDNGENILPCEL